MPRPVGHWTKNKLDILTAYLPAYLSATTKAFERIYVDGFSGPGTNLVRDTGELIDGSPLIALKATATNGTRFDRLYFVDKDPEVTEELKQTIRPFDVDKRGVIKTADVNDEIPRLLRKIPKLSPTFVLLDTDSIEPKWSTIELLAQWQTELLITFPLGMAINRNYESSKVVDFFGTDDCLIMLRPPVDVAGLLTLYKNRLVDLGYLHNPTFDRLVRTEGVTGQHLYYLIFVSKHHVGERIMKSVFSRPEATGQMRFRLD